MKKKAILSGLGLVFCGLMIVQAQEKVVRAVNGSDETKNVSINPVAPIVDFDTKLYANKEEAMSAEQASNPVKPTTPEIDTKAEAEGMSVKDIRAPSKPVTDTDPKLDAGIDMETSIEKAPEVNLSQSGVTNADIDANTGLEKVKTEGVILNYREIRGPQSQEIPAPQGKIMNYRELKGPDDQPREKQPAR